jgi:aminoglycoside phosphotransferase family enzyme/predicted kinase
VPKATTEQAFTEELSAQGFALIETHISRVYLRDQNVFKIKRAVDMGFLDFRALADRRRACEAELTLNRRLAPDVYLGLVALVRDAQGRLVFVSCEPADPPGVLEYAVHMRRLDDEARADRRLQRGQLERSELEAVARLIADFHQHARGDAETARFGSVAVITANVEENFGQVHAHVQDHLAPDEIAAIEAYQRAFLREHAALFSARVAAGAVRDGHGDLRLEHVYRTEQGGHVIIDCIEFNERFRFADVCADLAFFSMDLRSHGRADLADLLVAAYAEASADYGLYALLDFYESYRAFVRGKVASFLAHDPLVQEETREAARRSARRHFLLALSAARPALVRPRLIVCMGMIASGKSTLAEALADRFGSALLSADRARKQLLSVPPLTPLHDAAFSGSYAPEVSARVYTLLRERAAAVLGAKRSVILDATFRSRRERGLIGEVAALAGADVLFLECRCSRESAMARLEQRAHGSHVSDGRAEIYDALAARFEAVDELAPETHLRLDTDQPWQRTLELATRALS